MAADDSNDRTDSAAIKSALEHGISHLDTAELYGAAGHCEEVVGQAIKGFDRSRLQIVSKVTAANQSYAGVIKACQASLRRLNLTSLTPKLSAQTLSHQA